MDLVETKFTNVMLGSVFFDPQSGHKFQKINYAETDNAWRKFENGSATYKDFNADQIVHVKPSKIRGNNGT